MTKKKKKNLLQLDMFDGTEYAPIAKRVEEIGAVSDNVRRGLFARFDALSKRVEALEKQMAQKAKGKCEIIEIGSLEA